MYYTSEGPHSIKRAGMDGSNPMTIIATGLGDAWGITTNFKTSELFWTDFGNDTIESSDVVGGNRRTVVSISAGSLPIGIAVADGRVYWGEVGGKKIQSSSINGQDVITHYTGTRKIRSLTLVPDLNLPQNRTNHCATSSCSQLCVLTASSFHCLN